MSSNGHKSHIKNYLGERKLTQTFKKRAILVHIFFVVYLFQMKVCFHNHYAYAIVAAVLTATITWLNLGV